MNALARFLFPGAIGLLAIAAGAQPLPQPAELPKNPEAQRAARADRLFDFLEKEYALLLAKNKDRVSRSLLAISLSRIPRPAVSDTLLEMLRSERDLLVRAVVWEALVARADLLSAAHYGQLTKITGSMIEAGELRGRLRTGAAQLLAVSPPSPRTKELFIKLFAQMDSRQPRDDESIAALGHCLAAWKSPDVVEYLLGRMQVLDEAIRAAAVLYAAGCPLEPVTREHYSMTGQAVGATIAESHAGWWRSARANWKEAAVNAADEPWRRLRPHLLPSPQEVTAVDPEDQKWRKDLELRPPNLRSFDIGFVVDATGSMTPALDWLRRDLRTLVAGVSAICLEPRVSLTFYRDHGDQFVTQHHPLTGRMDQLLPPLQRMTAHGGGDVEEAVLDALVACTRNNPWSQQAGGRRVIVLVADAPAHADTQPQCEQLVKQAADGGTRLYVLKVLSPLAAPNLWPLDALATAGRGSSLEADARELSGARLRRQVRDYLSQPMALTRDGTELGPREADRPRRPSESRISITRRAAQRASDPAATAGADTLVGLRLLKSILVDAINPQYADRVEPMAAILWEILQEPTVEKQNLLKPPMETDSRNDSRRGVQDR